MSKARKRVTKEPSPDANAAAQYLYDAIKSHSPDFLGKMTPFKIGQRLTQWAKRIDVGMRNDGMDLAGCTVAIDYAHRSTDPFWRTNLLSGAKLRKHYTALTMKAGKQAPAKADRPRMNYRAIADKLDQL